MYSPNVGFMNSPSVYASSQQLDITPLELSKRSQERSVLMVTPEHYDVLYVINPHMEGKIGSVNKEKAVQQWNRLVDVYRSIGLNVEFLSSVSTFPDMVFCANQSFPFRDKQGQLSVIISRMASHYRQGEEVFFDDWYTEKGYHIIRQVEPPVEFEGMGDVLWHPQRHLLYAGYGYRTHKSALERLAKCVGFPVVGLELVHPSFYHLDTALAPLDEQTALYVEEALTDEGIKLLQKCFSRLIKVPLEEAMKGFVTNGHCPDGTHFIVNKGNSQTVAQVIDLGFKVIEVDTSEFIKSGGSVFCMKMMLPD